MPTDEDGIRHISMMSRRLGLAPLSTEEIYKILKQVTPPTAINGLKPKRMSGLTPQDTGQLADQWERGKEIAPIVNDADPSMMLDDQLQHENSILERTIEQRYGLGQRAV